MPTLKKKPETNEPQDTEPTQDNHKDNSNGSTEEYIERDRYGVRLYSDKLFDAIKKCFNTNMDIQRKSIQYYQTGYKLIFYQGLKANTYGFVEKYMNQNGHKIRIYNSMLVRILKSDENTKEFFKDKIL